MILQHRPKYFDDVTRREIERGKGAHGLHMYSLLFGRHMGV